MKKEIKVQVRRGIFETNSSSAHTLVMCSKSQFDDWKNGKMIYDHWNSKLVPIDDEGYKKAIEENDAEDYFTYEQFWEYADEYEENFEKEFNDVVAFGYYGWS